MARKPNPKKAKKELYPEPPQEVWKYLIHTALQNLDMYDIDNVPIRIDPLEVDIDYLLSRKEVLNVATFEQKLDKIIGMARLEPLPDKYAYYSEYQRIRRVTQVIYAEKRETGYWDQSLFEEYLEEIRTYPQIKLAVRNTMVV